MGSRWGSKAVRALFNGLGAYGLNYFRRNGGPPGAPGVKERTRDAVYAQIRRLYGPGGLTRGVHSLHALAEVSGYDHDQLVRARIALNQKWRRTGPKGAHLISEEQALDMYAWLQHGYWSGRHRLYSCAWCSTIARPHTGIGLCNRCYSRHRRLCQSYAIPTKPDDQLELVQKAGRTENLTLALSSFVGSATDRLGRGLVLEEDQLEWLLVVSDAADPVRDPLDPSGPG